MILVGRVREDPDPTGNRTDWVAVGDLHVFVGEPSALRAPCGAELEIQPREAGTLAIPARQASRAIDQFLSADGRCPTCARWLRENRTALVALERLGER